MIEISTGEKHSIEQPNEMPLSNIILDNNRLMFLITDKLVFYDIQKKEYSYKTLQWEKQRENNPSDRTFIQYIKP